MKMRRLTARLARATLIAILAAQLVAAPALANGPGGLSLGQQFSGSSGSEFVSGNYPGAILMSVNLWGSAGKPGIHHIPTQTDLVTFLSLAGGPLPDAQLDKVIIKRRNGPEETVIKVDVDDLLRTPGLRSPVLQANDIVLIPREKQTISNNTMSTIGFVSSILGLVLAGYAISNLGGK